MPDWSRQLAQAHALIAQGKPAQAAADLRRLLARAPADPHLNLALGQALTRTGQLEQAAYALTHAAARAHDDWLLAWHTGKALGSLAKFDAALPLLARAVALNPDLPETHLALATAQREAGLPGPGLASLDAARARGLADPRLDVIAATILLKLGRPDEALAAARRGARTPESDTMALSAAGGLAVAANYAAGATPEESLEFHRRFAALLLARLPKPLPPPARTDPDPDRPLRLGILSADLRVHSVASFAEPLLRHLRAHGFAITAYMTGPADDHSAHLRTLVDAWRDARFTPDADLAARVRADGIDILVETSGLTMGHRMGVMALRPAPVGVTAIGYPNTTGVPGVGFRLVDALTDPEGTDARATERPIRLPGCFLCYAPPADAPPPAERPADAPITFASFNNVAKLSARTLDLWAAVLHAVPGSTLLLKALDFRDPACRDTAARALASRGVPAGRLRLLEPDAGRAAHLARYHDADIALDTFPYHGTTTTCEALWMGLPVVTLVGDRHASRVGLSLLTALGLEGWAAPSPDEFVRTAAALAGDRPALARWRAGLRDRLRASPLLDGPGYAARVASALRGVWREHCAAEGRAANDQGP